MGGEKCIEFGAPFTRLGSPPHGRGKANSQRTIGFVRGITPAWAGKSISSNCMSFAQEDHPRMGGEKHPAFFLLHSLLGSPPHGRGKVIWRSQCKAGVRITPAWAGKRRSLSPTLPRTRDHPRMGGEKVAVFDLFEVVEGSPPHGRGKGTVSFSGRSRTRITPAWAGKSARQYFINVKRKDHPRMGGEKTKKIP